MQTSIHPTDIPVIAKIFNPISEVVFVVVPTIKQYNLSTIQADLGCQIRFFVNQQLLEFALDARPDQSITVLNLHPNGIAPSLIIKYPEIVLIDLYGSKHASTVFNTQQFDFIDHTDGHIRWMYDHQYKKPIFLNTYKTSNWRGEFVKGMFKTGFKVGLKHWLKSGSLWITTTNELFLDTINGKGQYAIFTGTAGENRKAVISFEQGQKATRFLKMPLTESAKKLVAKEWEYLRLLQSHKLRKMVLPKPKRIGDNLMVSNIRPEQENSNNDLKGLHLTALYELYNQTAAPTLLQESTAWLDLQKDVAFIGHATITNDLPKEKIKRIHFLLNQLVQQLTTDDLVPISIAHGDLTPWNSYLSDKAVHVYNWGLAERLPLFYDAFHYIFQSSILIKRLPFTAIERQIAAFAKIPIVEQMIGEFDINYEQVYQFYLLRNTAYYIRRFINRPELSPQVDWLIDTWLEALENLTYVATSQLKFSDALSEVH